jgi:hypothetical protein
MSIRAVTTTTNTILEHSHQVQLANALSEVERLKAIITLLKSEDRISKVVSGALIDFIGYLSSRPKTIKIGRKDSYSNISNTLDSFCISRGISLSEYPMVDNWNDSV